jgi:hypothetical protein
MAKRSHQHAGDEFGKSSGSGSPYAGLDGPMIGAAASIIVDGIAERESGVTPPPPPVSVKALVIFLVVMFLVGIVGIFLVLHFVEPHALHALYG